MVRVLGIEDRNSVFRTRGSGFEGQGLRFGYWRVRIEIQVSALRDCSSGFRAWVSYFEVQGVDSGGTIDLSLPKVW